jgi:hypothetical protein
MVAGRFSGGRGGSSTSMCRTTLKPVMHTQSGAWRFGPVGHGTTAAQRQLESAVCLHCAGLGARIATPRDLPCAYTDDGVFALTSTQLNGQSAGASYGDDDQMNENYPIVRLKDPTTGNVYELTVVGAGMASRAVQIQITADELVKNDRASLQLPSASRTLTTAPIKRM